MENPRLNRISIVLDEYNLDQLDLAIILSVSKDTVSRWCRNVNQPKLSDLYKIAKIFRIDMRRLIEPTDWNGESGLTIVERYKLDKKNVRSKDFLKKKK